MVDHIALKQRLSDIREMHYVIDEPDWSPARKEEGTVQVCYEEGSLWPCDTGILIGQIDTVSKLVDELTTLLYETANFCQRCPVEHPAIVRCAACRRKADKPESVVHDSDCPVYRLRTVLTIARLDPQVPARSLATHPFNPDPVKPLCTDCDEPETFHR